MSATSPDEQERLDRLAGSGRGSGGGLPLPALFSAMLNEVLDNAPVSTERMTEITSSALSFKQQAVFATWPSWEALAADVLAQMEFREIIRREDGSWVKDGNLITGSLLEIIPARKDKGSKSDGTTVWPKEERDTRGRSAHAERQATELIANPRPVDRNHAEEIRDSLATAGQLYKVLTDKRGRLLDGRHRRAADPNWPAEVATRADGHPVETEAEALAVIRAAGLDKPLPAKTVKEIDRLLGELAKSGRIKRDRVEAALLEDASRSNRAIAEQVGVSHPTVAEVRTELQEIGKIYHFRFRAGRGGANGEFVHEAREGCCVGLAPPAEPRQATPVEAKVEPVIRAHPEWSNNQALAEAGLNRNHHHAAASARARLEEEGVIPPAPVREGSDGRPRHVPSAVPPSPGNRGAEGAWLKITGRLGRLAAAWRNGPPDAASELEELEALRLEIEERIKALRES